MRRDSGSPAASDETVTKLLLTTGFLETQKNFLGSAQKNRVGRVTLNKVFFIFGLKLLIIQITSYIYEPFIVKDKKIKAENLKIK